LPPLQTLRAFESAARLGSFTRAADELAVTQGAISRQVRHLEERLGATLFVRADRGVRLTAAGARYETAVREALTGIAVATAELTGDQDDGPITVGATNAMASLWLMPRLTGFQRSEPSLEIRVLASNRDRDRASDEVDLAIEYARQSSVGAGLRRLFDERIYPVCSPEYLRERPGPLTAEDLPRETLLDLEDDHPDWMGWSEWFAALGIDNTARRQPVRVNNYPTLLQAAVAGQGIALGWRHLVDDFISAGSLVPALDVSVPGPGAFFISSSRPLVEGQPVTRLMNWLENKARPAT
jgi:LysR family glycine cleavage system transcriptional activator